MVPYSHVPLKPGFGIGIPKELVPVYDDNGNLICYFNSENGNYYDTDATTVIKTHSSSKATPRIRPQAGTLCATTTEPSATSAIRPPASAMMPIETKSLIRTTIRTINPAMKSGHFNTYYIWLLLLLSGVTASCIDDFDRRADVYVEGTADIAVELSYEAETSRSLNSRAYEGAARLATESKTSHHW